MSDYVVTWTETEAVTTRYVATVSADDAMIADMSADPKHADDLLREYFNDLRCEVDPQHSETVDGEVTDSNLESFELVDEIYGLNGVLLPYGRCDKCGQPDGEEHRHCSRCGDVVGVLNGADECAGCEESDDIITDELVDELRDENGLAPTREALKVIADLLHIINRVDADESIDYPGDPIPTAGMYRKAIVDTWSQL